MINRRSALSLAVGGLALAASGPSFAQDWKAKYPEIVLAIVPAENAGGVVDRFTPFAKYLEKELGTKVTLRVGPVKASFTGKVTLSDLDPLCTLCYSATHKNPYNLLYSLNPVQAYDLGLVKQIEVDGVQAVALRAGGVVGDPQSCGSRRPVHGVQRATC